jgi:hypothetical protein
MKIFDIIFVKAGAPFFFFTFFFLSFFLSFFFFFFARSIAAIFYSLYWLLNLEINIGFVCFPLKQAQWKQMFPCMIARAATIDLISSGMTGIRNGALHVVCFSAVCFFPSSG